MISVFGSDVGAEELREVEACFERQWLGCGPRVAGFEEAFRNRLGLDNFLLVDSGSNALYMAVELLELPKGSEVIVPTFTFIAVADVVVRIGARPIFVDVDPLTYNLAIDGVNQAITPKTKAIIAAHMFGQACDLAQLMQLANAQE